MGGGVLVQWDSRDVVGWSVAAVIEAISGITSHIEAKRNEAYDDARYNRINQMSTT